MMKQGWTHALACSAALAIAGSAQAAALRLQGSGDPAEIAAYRELVKAFSAAEPGIEVEFIPVGKQRDHMAKLATSFAAGDPPDLFLINFRRYGQFVSKGVLEPLGPVLAKRGKYKEADYYEQATEAFRHEGTLMCLPQNVASLVVFYNVAVLKMAGLPPPPPDWNWADFKRYAKAMTLDTNGDGKVDIYGFGFERLLIRLSPLVWQAGGDIVDNLAKPTRLTLDSPGAMEAMAYVRSFLTEGSAPPLAESKSEEYEARFARGALGMVLNSRRFVPILREVPALDWDVAPLPRHKVAATALHSDAYCMAKSSPNKEAAYRFLEFATGRVGAGIMARNGRTVPAHKAASLSADFLAPDKRPRSSKVFLDVIATMRRTPNIASWNEVEARSDAVIEDWYFNTLKTPQDLGKSMDEATRSLFNASGK